METATFSDRFTFTGSDFTISTDLSDILDRHDPEQRYAGYQGLLALKGPDLYKKCEDWYYNDRKSGIFFNAITIAFASFIVQLSLTYIRVNTLRILYNYCMTKGYLKNTDDVASGASLMSKFGKMSTSADKSLMDLSSATYNTEDDDDDDWDDGGDGDKDDEEPHDSNAMFEALDSVKASFKSDRYMFDVEDVINTDASARGAYMKIADKVKLVNHLLIKRIKDIKTYNVGGKNPGMKSGRIDRKTVYRYKYDPNIFYNNTYKTLESDLAFGIVLDESGSMSGRGIEDGRITMVVLHETLKALGINHSIVGHTSDRSHHVDIHRYQSFREDKTYTTCKNYALVKAKARWGNCDSGALYYMEKALDRVKNKDKICLIFSDGAPTECSGKELKDQVRHMERKGIKVIGIGINFESIAKYYTDYANGRNLSDMLNIVAKILEEYVLQKKDK
jgi:hypothetical protein